MLKTYNEIKNSKFHGRSVIKIAQDGLLRAKYMETLFVDLPNQMVNEICSSRLF